MVDLLDHDRGSHLAATYIAGCAIAFVFVVMRLCARFSIAGVGIDDWSMLITWIVFLPLTILVSVMCFDGGTRHLVYLSQDPAHMRRVIKMNWIAQPLCIFCLGSGKVAIAFLILRLLNRASVWRRWSLYIAIGWTTINSVLMIAFTFAQCENPAALWDDETRAKTKCWDPKVQSSFSIYGGAVHALTDFFLALLPLSLVWGLRTDLRKKVALCALLGCGSLTGICAAVKTSKLSSLNARSDFTWETFSLFMWTGIELILLIVCGSIPALKPIYAICMGRRPSMTQSSQRNTQRSEAIKKFSKKSYQRHANSNSDVTFALQQVRPPSQAEVSRGSGSDDGIGLAISGDPEKEMAIHVTRSVDVEYREREAR
ncbi:hypothetical protein EJ04DRAFT_447633 [Polyplosphaeria fusca]|uniref:Rhodopsin domain-containing protein n=1 Tax=Polyplosphaeria fusca TaxID=682080 RepID=A0A9P4QPA8_9PLEO|nr:hypothetical protein EJ04DRAFT_447633 [Polyplosphaeria fusca]